MIKHRQKPAEKKNILHIINGEHFSGAERVQDLLAGRLDGFGYNVFIACLKPKNFKMHCTCRHDRIHEFPMKTRFDFRHLFNLFRFARRNNIRLIHTHTPRTLISGAAIRVLLNLPLVHHLHSPTGNDSTDSLKNKINMFTENLFFKIANRIIPVSQSLKHYLIHQGVPPEKISLIYNGVPTADRYIAPKKENHRFTIGTVALFRERKGIEVLLEAVSNLIVQKKRRITVNAVGTFESATYEREIKQLVEKLAISDSVNWMGFKKDVQSEFKRMDLFVLPSLFGEGTPMVILESMAIGTPVLSTKIEGIPEVIADKEDGLLVNPGDVNEMAAAIDAVITQQIDASRLSLNAHIKQNRLYSDHVMVKEVATVYSEIF